MPPAGTGPSRLPAWALAEGPFGIRLLDVGIVALVIAAIEVNVIVGTGPGAVPLNIWAYLDGALLAVPILFRHRWPFRVMIACAVLIFLYYIFARRNISPAPLFFVPLYDAAVAGYLVWAIAIAAGFMITGLVVVELSTKESLATLTSDFLSQIVILALAVALGEVVRSRHALTAETASRLRLAEEERAAEAGRVVAEERLRIARELHDTVAHSMATITVQAGSALHLLGSGGRAIKPSIPNERGCLDPGTDLAERGSAPGASGPPGSGVSPGGGVSRRAGTVPDDPGLAPQVPSARVADADMLRTALTAIRETSKNALIEMRSVLGQLRRSDGKDAKDPGAPNSTANAGLMGDATGLGRLADLQDAVTAAGATVTVTIEGEQLPLSAEVDHSAYRILQESLTNVLRHAGPGATARVCLRYEAAVLTITVTDDGTATADGGGTADGGVTAGGKATVDGNGESGHGIRGMRERAASVGGQLTAGPLSGGGFLVKATLPTAAPVTGEAPPRNAAGNAPARSTADAPAPGATDAPAPGPADVSSTWGESL